MPIFSMLSLRCEKESYCHLSLSTGTHPTIYDSRAHSRPPFLSQWADSFSIFAVSHISQGKGEGKGCSPGALPPPASCQQQRAQPVPALQPFDGRTVSTWSARLRTAAASAGVSLTAACAQLLHPAPGQPLEHPSSRLPRPEHLCSLSVHMAAPGSAEPLQMECATTYQKLWSPQCSELNG